MKVEEVMKKIKGNRTKLTVNPEESIDNAALLMKNHNMDRISVINDNNRIVGTVTKDSIIEASDDLNEDFFFN